MDFLLAESPVPFRPLYLDHYETFVVVDLADYDWAMQWRWRPKYDKHRRKIYACRAHGFNGDGRRHLTVSVYLHKEICLRANGLPPSVHHTIADHCNGVSQDCRRRTIYGPQLRWATPSMNRQNINGWWAQQTRLQFTDDFVT